MTTAKKIPGFFIGTKNADTLIRNFQEKRLPQLNLQLKGGAETKSTWYDIAHIKELYEELEYLNADGVRVYFGAYSDGTIMNGQDVSGQICIVMVPTTYNESALKHRDLLLEETANFDQRPGSEHFIGNNGNNSELNRGFDEGKPCPPLCDEHEPRFPLSELS